MTSTRTLSRCSDGRGADDERQLLKLPCCAALVVAIGREWNALREDLALDEARRLVV
jgi:hypothetical protein